MIRVFSCLQRESRSGILYFRRIIPKRYRGKLGGRCEYKRSLNTHNKKVAIPRAMLLYSQLQLKFNEFDEEEIMDKKSIMEKIEIDQLEFPGGGKIKGFKVDSGDADKDIQILSQTIKVASATAQSSLQPIETNNTPQVQSEKLSVVCKKNRDEKIAEGSWRARTAEEYEATHALLLQVFRDVEITTITHAHARKLKELLLKLPPNFTKGKYAGINVKKIATQNHTKTLSPKTINDNYLQRYSSLFSWAVKNGYCAVNPFDGLKLKNKRKSIEAKDPFNSDELKAIFNPSLFAPQQLKKEWKYWIPLIALFSGCRLEEVAQLRTVDVFEEYGVHALTINEDVRKLKNNSSIRIIPLHPTLIEMGFLNYVKTMTSLKYDHLFPELNRGKSRAGSKAGRWFNETYLMKCGVKPTNRKLSFHSFRHTFINAFKKADVPETKVKQLTGHAHKSITFGSYGSEYDLKELYDVIKLVDFELFRQF